MSIPSISGNKNLNISASQPTELGFPQSLIEGLILRLVFPTHLSNEWIGYGFTATPLETEETGRFFETAKRTTSLVLGHIAGLISAPLWLLGGGIDLMTTPKGQSSYTPLKGKPEPVKGSVNTIFSLNACMFWGALPMFFGGLSPARYRIEETADFILSHNPDFICLQEVSLPAAYSLWDKLKNTYASGYTGISRQPLIMMDSGLFIASKYEILGVESVPLETTGTIRRNLFCVETASSFILTTHLEAGYSVEDKQIRQRQVAAIKEHIETLKKTHPEKSIVLVGDLNIQRDGSNDDEYSMSGLTSGFENFNKSLEPTCTNRLTAELFGREEYKGDEHIDYALLASGAGPVRSLETKIVDTYENRAPISDHKALIVTIS